VFDKLRSVLKIENPMARFTHLTNWRFSLLKTDSRPEDQSLIRHKKAAIWVGVAAKFVAVLIGNLIKQWLEQG